MTVSYNLDVSNTSLVAFLKLQCRWRGSIWKSILGEIVMFASLFGAISVVYHSNYVISKDQRKFWDDFAALFDQKLDYIPLTFMLGFFVTIIVGRWNDIFNNIGWVDNTALLVATYIRGTDEKSRMLRRNVMRYMVLTQVLIFRDISMQVRRRFPTLETIVAAGFMMESEKDAYNQMVFKYNKYFLPIQWCFNLLFEARSQGKIGADVMLNEIIKNVIEFRKGLGQLVNFDWVPIPLVYPQVVFMAVRIYFALCLIARQSLLIDGEPPEIDTVVYPVIPWLMTTLQFAFYVGWMKVAESLMNPLGEDDDDFECNFLLDRNLAVGLTVVDECYGNVPLQQKDIFWNNESVEPLYSSDTAVIPKNPQVGSAVNYECRDDEVVMMPHVDADDYEEGMLDDAENRILRRGVSVVSVNREGPGNLTRNRGLFGSLRSHFAGSKSRINRPSRLAGSSYSINTENNPMPSTMSIFEDLADEKQTPLQGLLTPDDVLASPRRSPIDVLTSVPEEDEEAQRTRNSADLRKWKKDMEQKKKKEEEEKKT